MAAVRGHTGEPTKVGGKNGMRSAVVFSLVLHTCAALALLFGGFSLRPDTAFISPLLVDIVSGPGPSGIRATPSEAIGQGRTNSERTGIAPTSTVSKEALRPAEPAVQEVALSRAAEGDGRRAATGSSKEAAGGTGTAGFVHAGGQGGDAAIPRYADNAPPVYPSQARRNGMEGAVILSVEVLPDGAVGDLRVKRTSGHPILDSAAIEAVKAWRFHPATRLGKPVTSRVEIPVRFSLRRLS